MKFLSVQPDIKYYIWQLQVQMHNFKKFGIEDKCIILLGYDPKVGVSAEALDFKEKTSARVIFLEDTRNLSEKLYIPSIRPHLIKKLYRQYGDLLVNKSILYHDSDILFTELPEVKDKVNDRKIYVSDTISYIGADYIKQKGEGLLDEMCKVVGINRSIVEKNQNSSGGAQYLFTSNFNLSYDFWDKVERDCNDLYKLMLVTSDKYNPQHPIQAWTADMWAVLWNLWLVGLDTEITDELSFSWATDPISNLDNHNIFHNAGVTGENKELFFKGDYINNPPFDADLSHVSDKFCSIFYVREIIETAKYLKDGH